MLLKEETVNAKCYVDDIYIKLAENCTQETRVSHWTFYQDDVSANWIHSTQEVLQDFEC